jgi:hypothetical protein
VASNIDRFKKDLESLKSRGELLEYSMRRQFTGRKEFDAQIKILHGLPLCQATAIVNTRMQTAALHSASV